MSKTMDLLSPDICEAATRYLKFFDCEIIENIPYSCKLNEEGDLDGYSRLSNFINGSQAYPEMILVMLEHFSQGIPLDEFEKLRWSTKEIQQKISLMFYPEESLMLWGIYEGEKWVDRSLRVTGDPSFNSKMYDKNGNLRLKNIFVHANHQYIYHCTLDVLEFLSKN